MIVTISGPPGSGKSSVAKKVARLLEYSHYSTGDFMRQLANDRKVNLLEFSKLAEKSREIDEELDQWQINLGKSEDNFVIDGRLSFHFIPESIKVYIDAELDERVKRVFFDRRGEEHNVTLENTKENLIARQKSEKKRYKDYYNINLYDQSKYDLVIESTTMRIEEVADKIVHYIHQRS